MFQILFLTFFIEILTLIEIKYFLIMLNYIMFTNIEWNFKQLKKSQ